MSSIAVKDLSVNLPLEAIIGDNGSNARAVSGDLSAEFTPERDVTQ